MHQREMRRVTESFACRINGVLFTWAKVRQLLDFAPVYASQVYIEMPDGRFDRLVIPLTDYIRGA